MVETVAFDVPTDKGPHRLPRHRTSDLSPQDRGVQGRRLRRGVGAQVRGQPFAHPGIGRQCRADPPAGHIGPHQQSQRILVVGIAFHRRGLQLAQRHAQLVIAPSLFTRDELLLEGFAHDLREMALDTAGGAH